MNLDKRTLKLLDNRAAKLNKWLASFYMDGTMNGDDYTSEERARMKKRNPNDATMRNINALKKRVARLEKLWKNLAKAKKKRSR